MLEEKKENKVEQLNNIVNINLNNPEIKKIYDEWIKTQIYNSNKEDMQLDKYILKNYICDVENFMKRSENSIEIAIFEIKTQIIKEYLR